MNQQESQEEKQIAQPKKRTSKKPKISDVKSEEVVVVPETDEQRQERESIERNKKVRADAYNEVVKLYNILSNRSPIEKCNEKPYSRTQVVRSTTLSHSKAQQILDIFASFHFIHWIIPRQTFNFTLNKNEILVGIHAEITSSFMFLASNIQRFKVEESAEHLNEDIIVKGEISIKRTIEGFIGYLQSQLD